MGFTGGLTDSNGQIYLHARQLDPVLGVFTATDPAGFRGSSGQFGWFGSPYGYVVGRTTSATDPSGRDLLDGLYRTLTGQNNDSWVGSLVFNASNSFVNFGRGFSGGLTDLLDNAISPGASCTVESSSWGARFSQGLGFLALSLIHI